MTRLHTRLLLVLTCLLAGSYASCGDEDEAGEEHEHAGEDHDHDAVSDASVPADELLPDGALRTGIVADGAVAEDDIDEDEEVPCAADYPVYRDGMSMKAGDLTVRVLSVSPAPPRQKTPNDWVIAVDNADGTPAVGVTLATPDSYMPVHRHHGRTPPKVAASPTPGQVLLNAIDFKMRGPWQVTFDVVPAGGKAITTTFQICVE